MLIAFGAVRILHIRWCLLRVQKIYPGLSSDESANLSGASDTSSPDGVQGYGRRVLLRDHRTSIGCELPKSKFNRFPFRPGLTLAYERDPEAPVRDADAGGIILRRPSMSRSAIVVLAIVLFLGSSGLSTGAFARGGGYDGGGGSDGFRGNHLGGGFGGTPRDGYGDNRASGLRGGFRRYGGHDVWGHWGAYYGPMI